MLFSMLKEKLEKLAPKNLEFSNETYGLQFGSIMEDQNLHNIAISLECDKEVIMKARKLKSHIIISHHGLTDQPMTYFNDGIYNEIKLLSLSDIKLFVIHHPWHNAKGGISDNLAKQAGLKIEGTFRISKNEGTYSLGRFGFPYQENTSVESICTTLKRNLRLSFIQIAGNPKTTVKKVLVKGGTGIESRHFIDIIRAGCNTIISGEFTYQEAQIAKKMDLNLIATSHYSSEKHGMENLQKILSLEFPRDNFYFIETAEPVLIF
ncbi:Nif3-like dinuclear metal center hexameric protein [Candidatus Lokiarchaeum ossiferum]|uniref:Nif3-like dinuclear metal center hexameric protein n=1 Tax=Candidatus Lokiarchaeum ossiferum TaxID=2951803 RepID=UPI00352F8088